MPYSVYILIAQLKCTKQNELLKRKLKYPGKIIIYSE